jgi:hypothetical protein
MLSAIRCQWEFKQSSPTARNLAFEWENSFVLFCSCTKLFYTFWCKNRKCTWMYCPHILGFNLQVGWWSKKLVRWIVIPRSIRSPQPQSRLNSHPSQQKNRRGSQTSEEQPHHQDTRVNPGSIHEECAQSSMDGWKEGGFLESGGRWDRCVSFRDPSPSILFYMLSLGREGGREGDDDGHMPGPD